MAGPIRGVDVLPMRPRILRATLVALVALVALGCLPTPAAAFDLESRVVEHRLANGMLFLLVRRPQAPVFTGYIRFRAGGLDEPAGGSGIAHLFEHMAFKGTRTVGTRDWAAEAPLLRELDRVGGEIATLLPRDGSLSAEEEARLVALRAELKALQARHRPLVVKDELSRLYLRNGAVGLNATTSKDLTSYFVSLPSNRLPLWTLLEASRIVDPVLRELWSEKDVVMEERRMRVEDSPIGKLYEALLRTAFDAGEPYALPTIGTWEDLKGLTADAARAFHAHHYQPQSAVGALVGDVDVDTVRSQLDDSFGRLPSAAAPTAPAAAFAPGQGERRVTVPFDAQPVVLVAFRKPNAPHRDDYVFDVLHDLLVNGQTSRLQRSLVRERGVVSHVGAFGAPGHRRPNLFLFRLVPRHPHTPQDAETALYEELTRLATEPIPAAELDKVRTRVAADFLRGLDSNAGLASQLTYFQAVVGDWRYVVRHRDVVSGVSADDVARVARTYLVPDNRVVATLVPLP